VDERAVAERRKKADDAAGRHPPQWTPPGKGVSHGGLSGVPARSEPDELCWRLTKGQLEWFFSAARYRRIPSYAEFGRQAVCGNSRHGTRRSAIDADKVRRNVSFAPCCEHRFALSPFGAMPNWADAAGRRARPFSA
jgi:hypothetical protein